MDQTALAPQRVAEQFLGNPVDSVERVSGGGNNGVYKITAGQESFALKFYRTDEGDNRDRLGTEIKAVQFLQANAITNVPAYVNHNTEVNAALFQWISGSHVKSPTSNDFKAAATFAKQLNELSPKQELEDWALASDACLSLSDVTNQTEERFGRLMGENSLAGECRDFLRNEFLGSYEEIKAQQLEKAAALGLDPASPIDPSAYILSPSDFGFHNALKTESGELVFLDFEYFGWDAPFKLVCDFILHPGMNLPESGWGTFINDFSEVYGLDEPGKNQIAIALPLFALRWCMIMLNVYLRNDGDIGLADTDRTELDNIRKTRLENTGHMLERARSLNRSKSN